MAEQTEAQKRAAARKAKILARGNAGLNKLAQTARGDEAEKLYGDGSKTPSTSTPKTEAQPSWAPPSSATASTTSPRTRPQSQPQPHPQASPEQDAMARQMEAMMSMLGGTGPQLPGGAGGEMPDFSKLLAGMMGGDPFSAPGGAAGANGQGMLGDMDDPAGLGGLGPGGIPPNLFGAPGLGADGAGAGGSPFDFLSGMQAPKPKSKAEKYFPLAHLLSVTVLAIFAVIWWEPALRAAAPYQGGQSLWADRWGGFAGRRVKGLGEVEVLPIFWAFVTVELILQTTRVMIFKSSPPPHSLLQNFLPILPPAISRPLLTGSRYLSLFSQTYKDGCMLVFAVGMTVVAAEWLRGGILV